LTSFNEFGLAEPINRALAEEKYLTPTPIQAQTVPLACQGRDVIGIAQTGTGKTAAFALPILNYLHNKRFRPERQSARVLVLSPTRELSGQIADSFRTYGRHIRPLSVELAIGGVPINRQIRAVSRGLEVLVATPGRLLDLVAQRALRLDKIEGLVLDEADRMLDMGFRPPVDRIVARLPRKRQTLFFSATLDGEVGRLASIYTTDARSHEHAHAAKQRGEVQHRFVGVRHDTKLDALVQELRDDERGLTLVFVRTKRGADRLVKRLSAHDVEALAMHGNKSQSQREKALARFESGRVDTLVATDVAARGLDIDDITHVINFDAPADREGYIHRVGRTGRAGRRGVGVTFVEHEQVGDVHRIAKGQGLEQEFAKSGLTPATVRGGHHNSRPKPSRAKRVRRPRGR